jgi:hypothetical protein
LSQNPARKGPLAPKIHELDACEQREDTRWALFPLLPEQPSGLESV